MAPSLPGMILQLARFKLGCDRPDVSSRYLCCGAARYRLIPTGVNVADNRTRRYLASTSAKRGYDREEFIPKDAVDDPTFVPRLSYRDSPPGAEWRSDLADSVETVPPDVCFFLDTNIWDKNLDPKIWQALLARNDSVYVIPSVRLELKDWILRNPEYIGSRAIRESNPNLIVRNLPPTDSDEMTAYAYYIYLLQSRRNIAHFYKMQFREKQGRDPNSDELMAGIQRTFGERGLVLVHKDGRPVVADKWATDESLVYLAAENALRTGRPTVILTKDQDVYEQFYKLWWFLDTHYRAMLIADAYSGDPFRYPMHKLPSVKYVDRFFYEENALLVEVGTRRMRAFLPRAYKFVSVECWLVRKKMERLTFGAETNMYRLLKVKGATGGLVSDRLQGRNLHPWLAPLPIGKRLETSIAIVRDRTITVSGSRAQVGMFDLTHSVNTHERHSRFAADPNASQSGLWTPRQSTGQSAMGLWPSRKPSDYSEMGLWRPPAR